MSSFQELDVVDRTLIVKIKEIITNNYYKPMFDMWLTYDADHTFGGWYQSIFKDHYGDFITEDVECRLWFASKNIIYAIKSFIYIKKEKWNLDELLDFVEYFVSEQLSQFGNDYDDYDFHKWSMIINNEETENIEEEETEDNNQTIL